MNDNYKSELFFKIIIASIDNLLKKTSDIDDIFSRVNSMLVTLDKELLTYDFLQKIYAYIVNKFPSTTDYFIIFDDYVMPEKPKIYCNFLPDIIINIPNYSVIICDFKVYGDLQNKLNEHEIMLLVKGTFQDYFIRFTNIEEFIKNNFPEVNDLSKSEFNELLRIMDKKTINEQIELDKKYTRLFLTYEKLEAVIEHSYFRKMYGNKFLADVKGYMTKDEVVYYPNKTDKMFFHLFHFNGKEVYRYKTITNMEDLRNSVNYKMANFIRDDFDIIQSKLLMSELIS